jgi:outer membrane protein TolC
VAFGSRALKVSLTVSLAVALGVAPTVTGAACRARAAADPPDLRSPREGGLRLVEAVELALEHDPNILLVETDVLASEGALRIASGRFDPLVTAGVSQDDAESTALEDGGGTTGTLESSVRMVQELRTGLTLEPGIEMTRIDGAGAGAVNRSTVRFTVRQPLLRDRGRRAVAAGEDAAVRELAAARLDLEHTVSLRILAVVSEYWRLEAARRSLEIAEAGEETSRRLLRTTRRLVAADVTPAADLVLLEADLAAKEALRIAGEQGVFAARRALGREIGLPRGRIAALLPPSDPFPRLRPDQVPSRAAEEGFVAMALARRADLRAAHDRLVAGRSLEGAARNALEPRLDLLVTPSYSAAVEGTGADRFVDPFRDGITGFGTTVALSLSWPTRNREAEGRLLSSRALRERSELEIDLLETRIGADVPTSLDAVRRSAERLVKTSEAVRFFARAVENEQKKLRAGRSTLIDVINQQDRLTAARQSEVSARLALALALAELRFETGTLTSAARGEGVTDHPSLTTLPSPGDA